MGAAELKERIVSGRCEPPSISPQGAEMRELVSWQCGATAFSTGIFTLQPKSELRYHTHVVSEAITIVDGEPAVSVEGRTYRLFPYDCIHIPAGAAHRIVNPADYPLSVYAGSEPERPIVDACYCSGEVVWPRSGK